MRKKRTIRLLPACCSGLKPASATAHSQRALATAEKGIKMTFESSKALALCLCFPCNRVRDRLWAREWKATTHSQRALATAEKRIKMTFESNKALALCLCFPCNLCERQQTNWPKRFHLDETSLQQWNTATAEISVSRTLVLWVLFLDANYLFRSYLIWSKPNLAIALQIHNT